MSRDYSKYNACGLGENLNNRKLVLKIVQGINDSNKFN